LGSTPTSADDPTKKLGRVSQFLGKLQLRKRVAGGIRQLAEQTAQSISKYAAVTSLPISVTCETSKSIWTEASNLCTAHCVEVEQHSAPPYLLVLLDITRHAMAPNTVVLLQQKLSLALSTVEAFHVSHKESWQTTFCCLLCMQDGAKAQHGHQGI